MWRMIFTWGRRALKTVGGIDLGGVGQALKRIPTWAWYGFAALLAILLLVRELRDARDAVAAQVHQGRVLKEKRIAMEANYQRLKLAYENMAKEKQELEREIEELQMFVFETLSERTEPDGTVTRTVTTTRYLDSRREAEREVDESEVPSVPPPWAFTDEATSVLSAPEQKPRCGWGKFWSGVGGAFVGLAVGLLL